MVGSPSGVDSPREVLCSIVDSRLRVCEYAGVWTRLDGVELADICRRRQTSKSSSIGKLHALYSSTRAECAHRMGLEWLVETACGGDGVSWTPERHTGVAAHVKLTIHFLDGCS